MGVRYVSSFFVQNIKEIEFQSDVLQITLLITIEIVSSIYHIKMVLATSFSMFLLTMLHI